MEILVPAINESAKIVCPYFGWCEIYNPDKCDWGNDIPGPIA